jgi:ABC-2 type transport system permease protein
MYVFLTLVKREFLEHKIAMFWVPMIIGAFMIVMTIAGVNKGTSLINFNSGDTGAAISKMDGQVTLDLDKDEIDASTRQALEKIGPDSGITVNGSIVKIDVAQARKSGALKTISAMALQEGGSDLKKANQIAPMAAAGPALPIFITALISIIFMLLGSLYEERSDRSILFWKSMPASDTQTVLAKGTAIIGGTLLISTLISIVVSVFTFVFLKYTARSFGLDFMIAGSSSAPVFFWFWVSVLSALIMYVLWAAPIYAWFLFVSAAAPRAPFLFATLPLVAIVVMEQVLQLRTGFGEEIGARLVGAYVGSASGLPEFSKNFSQNSLEHISQAPAAIFTGLVNPALWIGLVLAACFTYAAIQMRKRKAL